MEPVPPDRKGYDLTRYNHPSQNWMDAVLALRAECRGRRSPEPFASFIARRLGAETTFLVLVWDGDKPIGYALAFDVFDGWEDSVMKRVGFLAQFFVIESYRSEIAPGLMSEVDDWLESRGIKEEFVILVRKQERRILRGYLPYVRRKADNQ